MYRAFLSLNLRSAINKSQKDPICLYKKLIQYPGGEEAQTYLFCNVLSL